jgi:SPP1 gp7 family putative phage head morphogenesis protein
VAQARDVGPYTRREAARRKRAFLKVRRAELQYRNQLRKVARQIGDIVRGFGAWTPGAPEQIVVTLHRYAEAIDPWARAVAARMLADVSKRDELAWKELSKDMARNVRREIQQAPTGQTLRRLQEEQVTLIKSIPIDAAQRVHEIATGQLYSGQRADVLRAEIMQTGLVSRSKADLIARTETSRASSNLVQARATHIGSQGYVWRTAKDEAVRPSHREMEGQYVRWDDPPTLDNLTGHAGALPNCRCYSEPVFADVR